MENQINAGDSNIQYGGKASVGQSDQIPKKCKLNLRVAVIVIFVLIFICFATFYFQKVIKQSRFPITKNTSTSPPQKSDDIYYDYKIPFQEFTVIFKRTILKTTEGSFFGFPIKNYYGEINLNAPHEALPVGGLYYVKKQNTFYNLQPGGYSTLSLISEKDINNKIINEKGPLSENKCEMSNFPIGKILAKAIKCTYTYINPEDTHQRDISFTKNCYLPISNGKYVAYEQKIKPMGDVDLCMLLVANGLQNITIPPPIN